MNTKSKALVYMLALFAGGAICGAVGMQRYRPAAEGLSTC